MAVIYGGNEMQELMAKDAAERKAAERKRLKDAGYELLQGKAAWVPKGDMPTVLKYLERIRSRFEKKSKGTE
jgi:hypothetical protein